MKPQWKAIDFKWIKENKDAVAWVGLERSSVGHWWLDNIRKGFEEGKTYECMGSRQLSKLVHISLGGGGVRIRVYDQIMHYVNCHLAAHLEVVNQRNADLITCIEIWSSIGHLYLTQQLLVCLLLLTRFGLQILRE